MASKDTKNNSADKDIQMDGSSMQLPRPGDIVRADFRREEDKKGLQDVGVEGSITKPVRMVQFNIERGYQLPGIIAALRDIDADVLSLQEVDVGCDRSGGIDTGMEIARALGLNYAFLCEFVEIRSPVRSVSLQGGGVHGNAILTKFDIQDVVSVEHRYVA